MKPETYLGLCVRCGYLPPDCDCIQLTPENLEHLAIAFGTLGSPTTEKAIIFNMSLDQRQYIPKDSQKVFDIALEQGIIKELKNGKYKLSKSVNKEIVEKAARDRIYEEQTQEHEDYLVDEQAKQDEIDGINAEINADRYADILDAYYANREGV